MIVIDSDIILIFGCHFLCNIVEYRRALTYLCKKIEEGDTQSLLIPAQQTATALKQFCVDGPTSPGHKVCGMFILFIHVIVDPTKFVWLEKSGAN